ncbi:MAG: hypothetical protein K5668_05800 [Lachnospiraceae bacterium]|nr:hypothetical protein [Lachnospiraceae bacterium]
MLILTLILIILAGDRTEYFLKPALILTEPVYLLIGLAVSLTAFLFLFFIEGKKLIDISEKKRGYILIAVLSVLLFSAELIFTFTSFFYSDWDPAGVLDCVYKLLRGRAGEISLDYFSAHPNNLMLVYVYLLVLKLSSLFGTESVLSLMLFQSLLFTLGGVFFFFIVKDLLSVKAAVSAWFLYAVWIGLNPYLIITYSDAAGLIFPLITIRIFQYLMLNEKQGSMGTVSRSPINAVLCLVMGLSAAAGYMIKPQTVIALIAVFIMTLLYSVIKKDPAQIGRLIIAAGGFIISFFIISNVIFPSLKLELDKSKSFSFSHYLMMGLNPETDGVYSNEDTEFTNSIKDPSERRSENLRVAAERFNAYGIRGLAGHLKRKQLINFGDGSFSWGIDGNFFAGPVLGDMPEVQADSALRPFILSFLETGGSHNDLFKSILQVFWLTVLFFGAAAEIIMIRKMGTGLFEGNPAFFTMTTVLLSLTGLIFFELLFEAKARYLFTFLPVFLTAGVYGACSLYRLLRRRLSSSK